MTMARAICISLILMLSATSSPAQSAEVVPRDVAFHFDGVDHAPDGFLYFGGSWKGDAVFRSTPEGAVEVYARGFDGPTDTVMDSRGNVFVSNYNTNVISVIAPDRSVRAFATTPQGPAGMAIGADDTLYVTIFGLPHGDGRSILAITPEGAVSTYVDSPDLHGSVGLAIDDQGVLYVSAGRDGRIFRVPERGRLELFSCIPLMGGRGAGGHLDWAGGSLFAASGVGALYRIDQKGAVHLLLQDGSDRTPQGAPRTPLLEGCNGVAASADGSTLFLGCAPGGSRELIRVELAGAPPGTRAQDGWAALQGGDFDRAERLFAAVLERDDGPAGAWYGLGLVRHRAGAYLEAAELFARAADDPSLGANASYNQACAFALAKQPDQAFAALDRARLAGFADVANLVADKDLTTLHADGRWKALLARMGS